MTTALAVPKVAVGQPTPWGIATRFCEGDVAGRWACAAHGMTPFLDRAALAAHVDDLTHGPHLIAWRCRRDGQTHGWRR